jgi:hypothetical protein
VTAGAYVDPCLPTGYNATVDLRVSDTLSATSGRAPHRALLVGSGNPAGCAKRIRSLFHTRQCPAAYERHCSWNGHYQPRLAAVEYLATGDFHRVVSSTENAGLGLGPSPTVSQIREAADRRCLQAWPPKPVILPGRTAGHTSSYVEEQYSCFNAQVSPGPRRAACARLVRAARGGGGSSNAASPAPGRTGSTSRCSCRTGTASWMPIG